ncbi:MAG: menaquinone biosynthesis protein [Pyrinomonas methylaliphatogenes]|nr:menaquinone biosynthesis protein [Pyrinomonas methylaliphatogenes]
MVSGHRRLRIAASIYLNSAPLIWSFRRGSLRERVELWTDAAPARCADMLARGLVDVALVPVIEYQRLPETLLIPGVCVGARARVRSVVIVTRGMALEEVENVALDLSSRTSAALVQIIFREFLGRRPHFVPARPDLELMLREHDAALLIGDPAMTFAREGRRVYDLAEVWRAHTGLGFVFAMWMTRMGSEVEVADFARARAEGLARVEEIVAEYAEKLALPPAELREYLLENISFIPDGEMRAGLELYFQLAHKHGLIDALRPLAFVGG